MRKISLYFAVLILAIPGPGTYAGQGLEFDVIAYHDVRDEVSGDFDLDQYAISTTNLIDHFTWLRQNGFNVVSIDDINAARRGERSLPERAVMLTFDDGFRSVVTHVLPLLELFEYPAVISIVSKWIESDDEVVQGGQTLTREDFLTWQQVRMLSEHPLVEIASHSHDLHRGVVGNPQGNEQPAAVTMTYTDDGYESDSDYATRIRLDLEASVSAIERFAGVRPRVMTWPYGAFNEVTLDIAAAAGMEISLTLNDGKGSADSTAVIPRHLVEANPGVDALGWALLQPPYSPLVRAAQVDLDYVFDTDSAQQQQNLSDLLDRIQELEITHVFLQAFADPDADGGAQELYFPNRHLPVRADLFNRVAWQLTTRAQVRVYAWLPILSFEGENIDPNWRVMQLIEGERSFDPYSEPRLSPFSDEARTVIREVYEDLARHAPISGILFHDDGRFNEFEDWSDAAIAYYSKELGEDFTAEDLNDSVVLERWSKLRSNALIDLTNELEAAVRRYRPQIKTVRNMFATALLRGDSARHLAQEYEAFNLAYDHIALMAMPRFENYADEQAFYSELVALTTADHATRDRIIFQLQTVDWKTDTPIPAIEIRDTMRWLQSLGVRHLAYYPEDFVRGHPEVSALKNGMSVATFPRDEE